MNFCIHFTILMLSALFLHDAHSNDDINFKSSIIEEIVRKVGNITVGYLANSPPEEKNIIMGKIEGKLKKTALSLGKGGNKYVKFIMHGIKRMAFNNSENMNITESKHYIRDTNLRNANNNQTKEVINYERKEKEQAIKNIAAKIEILANKYLKESKTPEDKKSIIDNIKKRVMDSANRKHMMIHSKHHEIKTYGNLIAKGVDLVIERNKENDTRRMDIEFVDNVNNDDISMTTELISSPPKPGEVKFNKLDCDSVIEETCTNAKSLNKFTCRIDSKVLPLEKLCDGVNNCIDKSDEQDCAIQAVEKIRRAGHVMSNIESSLSRKCFTADVTEPFMSKQNKVLLGVLHTQLKIIGKYTDLAPSQLPNSIKNELDQDSLKKTANEVAMVVSSLARALDGSLCARRFETENLDEFARKYISDGADEAFDDIMNEKMWSPKSCACSGALCTNSSCTELCKRVCWQKYSLDRWTCHAVDGGPSVSLDLICDGKLDCYDETDEHGCSLGDSFTKFEAGNMYNDILKQVATKARVKAYNWILQELLTLHDSIKILQKISTKRNVEITNVKIVREQCFSMLSAIYERKLHKGDLAQINEIYSFLIFLSEKLVGAMKRSSTGNEKIISSTSGGCFCTGSRCSLPRCPSTCVKACAAEPTLTKYFCDNWKLNNSVPLDAICNGKSNCPNGEDEVGCKKDICRAYHLRVLRFKLQDVGQKQKGSGLGEAIKSWKTKVTSTLKIAEKNDRPTLKVLKDIITNILHDLVMSYATIEEFRRSTNRTEHALKEFAKISQIVIDTLKSCGH